MNLSVQTQPMEPIPCSQGFRDPSFVFLRNLSEKDILLSFSDDVASTVIREKRVAKILPHELPVKVLALKAQGYEIRNMSTAPIYVTYRRQTNSGYVDCHVRMDPGNKFPFSGKTRIWN